MMQLNASSKIGGTILFFDVSHFSTFIQFLKDGATVEVYSMKKVASNFGLQSCVKVWELDQIVSKTSYDLSLHHYTCEEMRNK